MKIGLSTHKTCFSNADCLKNAGYQFVIRYYSLSTSIEGKVITPEEAKALTEAGLEIAVVYQDAGKKPMNFDYLKGKASGYYAYSYAKEVIRQPINTGIYFGVDYDAKQSDLEEKIRDFFEGVYDIFGELSNGTPEYDIGVYGSGLVCKFLKEHKHSKTNLPFIKYTWLAQSSGWREFSVFSEWDVKQSKPRLEQGETTLCGFEIRNLGEAKWDWETCHAKDNFGQFVIEL